VWDLAKIFLTSKFCYFFFCNLTHTTKAWFTARFTLGVRANVQPKTSISIGAKVEIGLKGFTPGVKAEIEKKNFNLPQATNKC
jgi:hypothetical protein